MISTECQIEIANEVDVGNPTIGTFYIGSSIKQGVFSAKWEIAHLIHKARGECVGDDEESRKDRKRLKYSRNRFQAIKGPKLPPCPDLSVSPDAGSSVAWDRWQKDCVNIFRANDVPCPSGFLTQPQVPGDRASEEGGYQCSDCDEVFKKPGKCLHHMRTVNHKTGLQIMLQCVKNWKSNKSRRKQKEADHAKHPLLTKIFHSEDPDEIRAACAKMDKEMGMEDREMFGDGYDEDDDEDESVDEGIYFYDSDGNHPYNDMDEGKGF